MTAAKVPVLVSTDWLAAHLDDPSVKVAGIRIEPGEPDGGHIPGALSWFWKDAFWDTLAREFATPDQLARRLAAQGISETTTLVLYSPRVQFSIYGHWVLTEMCGHPDTRVLDGGWPKWLAEGRPVAATAVAPDAAQPGPYRQARAERDDATRIRREELLSRLGGRTVIVDARSAEEYAGLRVRPLPGFDHGAERAGRIPGARHLPVSQLLGPDGTFRPKEEIEAIFRAAGAAPDQAEEVIAYCRLGHRASMAWFAASRILGWSHLRVYDGSWTEWGSSVGMPVERDEPPAL